MFSRTSIDRFCLVPLPVDFTFNVEMPLISIMTESPPAINVPSTYEVSLGFFADDAARTFYPMVTFPDLNGNANGFFIYGLLPNLTHEISVTHTLESVGYATSKINVTRSILWFDLH